MARFKIKAVQLETEGMSNSELAAAGYRVTSRKHRMIARVDRPKWREHMALMHAPWDPDGDGVEWVNALRRNSADQYRRVYSEDKVTVQSIEGIPNSSHDCVGYVEDRG